MTSSQKAPREMSKVDELFQQLAAYNRRVSVKVEARSPPRPLPVVDYQALEDEDKKRRLAEFEAE